MQLRIEIAGGKVTCRQDGRDALSVPLEEFFSNLQRRLDARPLADAIPEGVRFAWSRDDVDVLAVEEKPAVRTVRWLADDSPVPFGKGAVYRTVRLAFPFVVLVIVFKSGAITGFQQCFYRREPLRRLDDELLLPNLYNVARAYDQHCWLCLANLRKNLAPLDWAEKLRVVWTHTFNASFNASSEKHEGMSFWGAMRNVDPRVASVVAWEEATRQDPLFPLSVEWRPVGRSVGQVMEEMMTRIAGPPFTGSDAELVSLVSPPFRQAAPRRSFWLK